MVYLGMRGSYGLTNMILEAQALRRDELFGGASKLCLKSTCSEDGEKVTYLHPVMEFYGYLMRLFIKR